MQYVFIKLCVNSEIYLSDLARNGKRQDWSTIMRRTALFCKRQDWSNPQNGGCPHTIPNHCTAKGCCTESDFCTTSQAKETSWFLSWTAGGDLSVCFELLNAIYNLQYKKDKMHSLVCTAQINAAGWIKYWQSTIARVKLMFEKVQLWRV